MTENLAKGQRPFSELVVLRTTHDVRKIEICPHCHEVGTQAGMIDTRAPMGDGRREWWHGRCFVKHFGIRRFRDLPYAAVGRLMLGDIGVELMKVAISMEGDETPLIAEQETRP